MAKVQYWEQAEEKKPWPRVRLVPGEGNIIINNRSFEDFFPNQTSRLIVQQPLVLTAMQGRFDIRGRVNGGGVSGQAGAIQLGIARALLKANPDIKAMLRRSGFLTRDPRMKERKKYGLHKARKAPQYSKR